MEVPYYGVATYDEDSPDYGENDLFDEGIQPEQNRQLVPMPPIPMKNRYRISY